MIIKRQAWKQPSFKESVKAHYLLFYSEKIEIKYLIKNENRILLIYRNNKPYRWQRNVLYAFSKIDKFYEGIKSDNASMSSRYNVQIVIVESIRVTL